MKKLIAATMAALLLLVFAGCSQVEAPMPEPPTISDAEIEAKLQNAWEAMAWFRLSSMPVEWELEPHAVSEDGMYYWIVIHEAIGSMADLEAHLRSIFVEDIVTYLLFDQRLYRDFDGVLHSSPGDRGGRVDVGNENREIIRVSANEIIYRVHLDILEWDADAMEWTGEIYEVEIHDFHLIYADGLWLFKNFHLWW